MLFSDYGTQYWVISRVRGKSPSERLLVLREDLDSPSVMMRRACRLFLLGFFLSSFFPRLAVCGISRTAIYLHPSENNIPNKGIKITQK